MSRYNKHPTNPVQKNKIPVDKNGKMLSYEPHAWYTDPFTWEDHREWDGQINFKCIGCNGHSHFTDTNGTEYVIFSSDADEVLKRMEKGVVFGKWRTVKRGQSFGIMPVKDN